MTTPVEQWLPGMHLTAGRLEAMNQRSWLMVTNYGADSSGSVDSAPAIQAALNDARDRGGAWVLVPPGVYLTGSALRIYGNTRLTLMSGAEIRRNHGGTMLVNGDNGQNLPGYTGHSNIILEGGLWNMRGTTPGMTSSAMGLSFGHCQDIVLRDLEVRDVPGFHAVELNSTNHALIQNCRFRGFVDPGGRDFSEAVQLDLAKSAAVFGTFGPYDHTETKDVTISACHFGDSGTPGTTAWPRGIGSHSATITKWHRRIRISDCSFENLLQFAVSAYNWEDVTVTGNTFVSCGSGVRLRAVIKADAEDTKMPDGTQTGESQEMRNITVTGNSFRAGGGYDNAIVVYGESPFGTLLNVAIVGNTIDGTSGTQSGIRLFNVSRAVVSDNVVANTDNTAISTEAQNNTVISGNVVWGANGNGITMVNSSNSNIIANQVRDPDRTGILVQGGSDIQIRDNFVDGPNQANTGAYGIQVYDGTVAPAVTGNKCRPGGATTKAVHGLYITSTTSNGHSFGNDMRGTWTGTALNVAAGVNRAAADLP